jgi:hypothetical protein
METWLEKHIRKMKLSPEACKESLESIWSVGCKDIHVLVQACIDAPYEVIENILTVLEENPKVKQRNDWISNTWVLYHAINSRLHSTYVLSKKT